MERAGWLGGLFKAVNEYQSVSISGPSATSKPMERKIKWFATNGKTYYGLFFCEEHGLIKGRFKIKHTDDEQYYAVKILKRTDDAGAEKLHARQLQEREHRRQRRLNKQE